jgi:hypothetical protein
MKIVVIGGTAISDQSSSPNCVSTDTRQLPLLQNSGVNAVMGEGLVKILKGASAVVDASNAPAREDASVMNFFETGTRNLPSTKRSRVWDITSPCLSQELSLCSKAATFTQKSLRKIWSRPFRSPILTILCSHNAVLRIR